MTALLFLQRYWKPLSIGAVILALVAALMLTRHTLADRTKERDDARVTLQSQIATYEAAAKAAETKAKATDARNAQITQETQNDLQAQLTAARASAADYAGRLRNPVTTTNPGSGSSVPQAADAASGSDGAGDQTLVDDLRICSDAVVKADGWRSWWQKESADVAAP